MKEAAEAIARREVVEALQLYSDCKALDSLNYAFNINIWYEQGCALASINMCDEAIKALNTCVRLDKENIKAMFKIGEVMQQQKNYEAAIQ